MVRRKDDTKRANSAYERATTDLPDGIRIRPHTPHPHAAKVPTWGAASKKIRNGAAS